MNWFAYRRRRWLVAFGAGLLAVLVWQICTPRHVEVVIYNDTIKTLSSVQLGLGTTTLDYGSIEPRHSVVLSLPIKARGELVVWTPDQAVERATGPWIDHDEIAQVVVRVGETGLVTFSVFPSWGARMSHWLR